MYITDVPTVKYVFRVLKRHIRVMGVEKANVCEFPEEIQK